MTHVSSARRAAAWLLVTAVRSRPIEALLRAYRSHNVTVLDRE